MKTKKVVTAGKGRAKGTFVIKEKKYELTEIQVREYMALLKREWRYLEFKETLSIPAFMKDNLANKILNLKNLLKK